MSTRQGVQAVIEMLAHMDAAGCERLLADLARRDPALAAEIEKGLFTFDRLREISPGELCLVWREIPPGKLALAMRKCPDELKTHVFSSFTQRGALGLHEEIQALGPQKLSEVEAAQREIVSVVKRLIDSGQIRDPKSARK